MKVSNLLSGAICLFLVLCFSCQKENTDDGEIEENILMKSEMLNAESMFSMSLFSKLQSSIPDSNLCISPYSLYEALAMTANGAGGTNLQEFMSVLELDKNYVESLNSLSLSLRTELLAMDSSTVFTVVNSFWYNQLWTVYPEFIKSLEDSYQAKVSSLNFSEPSSKDIINDWVSYNTNGKITDLVNRITPSDRCFLVNAIYFKGQWTQVFNQNITIYGGFRKQDGESVGCQLMQNHGPYEVFADDKHIAAKLPYGDGSFAMYVFMPEDYKKSLSTYFTDDIQNNWPELDEKFAIDTTRLMLPQFQIESDFDLRDILNLLGLNEAFESSADFTNMGAGSLWISKVRQKTFINVNEEGTEGAAATAVSITGSGMVTYRFARPFIYIIADTESGTPIFMGQVTEPLAAQ